MAEMNQPRPRLGSFRSHSHSHSPSPSATSHPLASTSTHPSLTRRTTGPQHGLGVTLTPSISLPGTQSHPTQANHGHSLATPYHRPHAKTISTARPTRRPAGGVSEADLLGVEPSSQRTKRAGNLSTISSPTLNAHVIIDQPREAEGSGARHRSPKRADSTSSKPLVNYLDSLGREELDVVETRFDIMSKEEIHEYLSLTVGSSTAAEGLTASHSSVDNSTPDSAASSSSRPPDRSALPPGDGDKSPLFPPSPPTLPAQVETRDHPLRILSRAIREMREVIEKLEKENERLRQAQTETNKARKRRSADRMSIHDNLTEAISTSLTSDSPLRDTPPRPSPFNPDDRSSLRPSSPTPSTSRSIRPPSIASSISVPFPASPLEPSIPITNTSSPSTSASGTSTPVGVKKANRTTWTSGLWVWGATKKPRPRQGSIGSIASMKQATTSGIGADFHVPLPRSGDYGTVDEEVSDRRGQGDGGSSPAYKAIFLATRLITPDPSSILVSADIPSNSLVAYLAHSLVSNARDEGIVARDPISDRRRSRDLSRSRAASIVSQDAISPDLNTSSKDKVPSGGYGDQALAATASLGRTLLSSVSSATMRGTRAITSLNEETRPSLLSRASSSRGFPTTAISAPMPQVNSGSSATSPTEERPLPSVELSSIVPDESRPPTVLLSRQNLGSFFQNTKGKLHTASRFESDEEPLTDRYGFIYDIQHAKMLKDASAAGTPAPASLNGVIPPSASTEAEGWIARRRRNSHESQRSARSRKMSLDQVEAGSTTGASPRQSVDSAVSPQLLGVRSKTPEDVSPPQSRSSSQVDTHRHRSSTLLNLNPSPARPVTAKDHLTVSARGASSLLPDVTPSLSAPPLSASLAHASSPLEPSSAVMNPNANASRLTISSLLDQLTEIHDRQQKDRQVEWDAFLRRRARHRAATHSTHSGSSNKTDDLRWGSGLIGVGQMGLNGKGGQEDWKQFTRLVRKGIPLKYRSDIWAECSGAKDLMVPGEYSEILTVHKDDPSPFKQDIEKDVGRTFPGNVFFGGDGPGVAKLRRVLTAYAWHNPAVGYCQGMNMLAATLLLTHTDEEQAYWVLTSLIDRLLPANFYSPSLLASRADQAVLNDLVTQLVPKVHVHLEGLGVDLASITFGWWLSLFTDCLPVETLFRVWDVFFVEGHDTLFRVAIAILKSNEAEICATESVSDLFNFISNMTSRLWNADKLIGLQHSYKPIIRHIDLVARCEKAVLTLQAELGEE
ncbi:hypothetical protein I317_05046 [Kwoniella heveanensis CBS 569]|nr:hypothetical protein I317_05046 [Kwoniella heveanensis CBS 569]